MDATKITMIALFLLCVTTAKPAGGQTLDVCASCHVIATCDDKLDGSGKVCNCKYGFVGNGRTFCQDKDECQIGASKICGPHTTCHNTYGSYYCRCLSGYSPSNNMDVFIPNDGTHCQDIDECRRILGLCGDGGLCRNLEGSFYCSCQLGYQVHNGPERFNPHTNKAFCKVVDCGRPAAVEDMVLLSVPRTTYGSVAMFACDEGFVWRSGANSSVCGADGRWRGPTAVCEDVDCGSPPSTPHAHILWNKSSRMAAAVHYQCHSGYHNVGKGDVSMCTAAGSWERPPVLCQETLCGFPPVIEFTEQVWNNKSTPGSTALYFCKDGFHYQGGHNVSTCSGNGQWTRPTLSCQEINCQRPVFKPHAKMLWDGTSHLGSVVRYQCEEGYHTRSPRNVSVCGESGLWEDTDIWCEEIRCGPPLKLPHTNLLWDGSSTPGSVVLYECMDGFYQESGHNVSSCLLSGEWGEVSVKCKVKCGPVPILENSDVLWHNRSVVIHRCVDGYHSWRGSNVSVCSSSGVWENATMTCVELKPPVTHLFVVDEKCVHWRAEKYEDDTEVYKVTCVGSRDYQKSFHDKTTRFLRSKSNQLEVCLKLLPVTNYSISITAVSARFTASITTNTSLTAPPAPDVYFREFETPVPMLKLRRSLNTLDPISMYQVFVLPVEGVMTFDCSSPASLHSSNEPPAEYIAAMMEVRRVGMELNFTVGDGLLYGGCFNARLENGRNYYIVLRAVSQWNEAERSTCVLWAKVRGTSFVMKVSASSAAASVVFVAVIMLGGFIWHYRKT
ncbi:sushi domain-containing protein 1 isoform X2 [Labrus mixtus]|uniref:sushi domain-containing protein 1 isoform X2 n=1 Tax=Labrus mixtus TaxID=508554 RepID=UPI0029BFF0F6|nr:sushi domain-containing protein 1 isoform X2 [Labrus mixtus]